MRLIDADAMIRRVEELQKAGRVDICYFNVVREAVQMEPTVDDRELLPCPFCGGEALGPTDAWPHTITCEQCGAAVKGFGYDEDGMKEAVEKWNRRAVKRDG